MPTDLHPQQSRPQVAPLTIPEDAALYACGCGTDFTAAVTAGVTCPSCGHGQAW